MHLLTMVRVAYTVNILIFRSVNFVLTDPVYWVYCIYILYTA